MNVKPIDKAYGAESFHSPDGIPMQNGSKTLNLGTTCGGHSLILATNGSDRSVHVFITQSENGEGVPIKTGLNADTNPNCKHVCIPRYGMMVIQKKPNEFVFVTQYGGPESYSDIGGAKLTNVIFTPVAYI